MKNKLMFSALLVLALVVSACGTAAPTGAPTVAPVSTSSGVPVTGGTSTPLIPITGQTATVAPVATTPPAVATTPPAVATTPPAVATTPPAMATTPPAVGSSGSMATPSGPAAINLGPFLVDSRGMAIYVNSKDTPNTSTCTGNCATIWLPVLTVGAPTVGAPTVGTPAVGTPTVGTPTSFMGLNASMLGTITRTDGTVQVTYNGWPLYTYSKDLKVGDINGEGFNSQWYLITADGNMKK